MNESWTEYDTTTTPLWRSGRHVQFFLTPWFVRRLSIPQNEPREFLDEGALADDTKRPDSFAHQSTIVQNYYQLYQLGHNLAACHRLIFCYLPALTADLIAKNSCD